jgi:hypothetical protein
LRFLLLEARREHAANQMLRALADVADHFLARGFFSVELRQHAVEARGEVVGRIDHRAVEVDDRGFDARRREGRRAHYWPCFTVASAPRISSMTAR